MLGDYNKIIVSIFDSISKWFTDLSCKASEVLDGHNNYTTSYKNRFEQAFYVIIGSIFMLLYGLLGLMYGIFRFVFSLLRKKKQETYSNSDRIMTTEILWVGLMCLGVFFAFSLLSKNDIARKYNRYYLDNRDDINIICRDELSEINTCQHNSYLYHLRKALECNNSSNQVNKARIQLNDGLPEGLHFATLNDYLMTLLSLEQFDILERYASIDEDNNIQLFHHYLSQFCKESFYCQNFHKSNAHLELIMKLADYKSITSNPHHNNSFYLMRLFNEVISDRYHSNSHNNQLLSYAIEDVSQIELIFDEYEFNTPVSSREKEIIEYLRLVNIFNNGYHTHQYPIEHFLRLATQTKSNILKEYALNMALRSQYEYTNHLIASKENQEIIRRNLETLRKIQIKCQNDITIPYLRNTLYMYII